MSFLAYDRKVGDNTKRVAVGQAHNPHRMMLNHSDKKQDYWDNEANSMTYRGWKHMTDFWALNNKESGAIRVAVGDAYDPHRCMLNHDGKSQSYWDQGNRMTYWGW